MKGILKIVIVLVWLFSWADLNAQLFDVYTGKTIEVEHRVVELTPKIKYVTSELDYDCLFVTGEPTSKTAYANSKVLELFKSYVLSEEKFQPVYREMGKRVDQYNKLANSLNKEEYRNNTADKLSTRLNDMNCRELSYVSDLLFFSVNFGFWMDMGYNNGIDFTISEYYYVNLKTAEITKLDFEWNEAQKEKILSKMKDELNTDYCGPLTNFHYEDINELKKFRNITTDDSAQTKKSAENFKDVSSKINVSDADFYWLGWGLMVSFQEFTESSGLYSGNAFEVFVPMDKAKEMLEDVPEFSFAKKLNLPETKLKDFNLLQASTHAMDIYDPRDITDFAEGNLHEDKPKIVTVNYYQVLRDSSHTNLASWTHEFTKDGKLLKTTRYSKEGKISGRTEFLYSERGNLLLKAEFDEHGSSGVSEEYSYDENGNLLQIIYKRETESHVSRYFYNGNEIYEMRRHYIKDGSSNHFSKNYYDGKELKMGDQTYFLNGAGKMMGVKSEKYVMYQVQLSRNEKNQLVEVHRENDRYNRFYEYDDLSRLVLITNFENARLGLSVEYTYDGIFPFPKKMESFDPSGGHDTRLVQEYTWELYE